MSPKSAPRSGRSGGVPAPSRRGPRPPARKGNFGATQPPDSGRFLNKAVFSSFVFRTDCCRRWPHGKTPPGSCPWTSPGKQAPGRAPRPRGRRGGFRPRFPAGLKSAPALAFKGNRAARSVAGQVQSRATLRQAPPKPPKLGGGKQGGGVSGRAPPSPASRKVFGRRGTRGRGAGPPFRPRQRRLWHNAWKAAPPLPPPRRRRGKEIPEACSESLGFSDFLFAAPGCGDAAPAAVWAQSAGF